jgi:hypothetical protein
MRLKFPHRDSTHCPQPEFIQYIFGLLRHRTTCAETASSILMSTQELGCQLTSPGRPLAATCHREHQ